MLTGNYLFVVLVLVLWSGALGQSSEPAITREDYIRQVIFNRIQDSSMLNHLIKSMEVKHSMDCVFECLQHPSCKSINYQTQDRPRHLCELNNNTLATKPGCKQSRPGFDYYVAKEVVVDPCSSSPCKNGAVCSRDVCNAHGYHCLCNAYNTGIHCDGWTESVSSCKEIHEKTSHRRDMTYTFAIQGKQTDIFCHMTEISGCGTGGWTLAMKIDGTNNTFGHYSSYWSNKIAHNMAAGKTGFDSNETKMPSYWAVPFNTICVGFTVNGVTNFAAITYTATSLYDVIADGSQRVVGLLGKSKWMSLIGGSSMQDNCNMEGFNLARVRIGIIANNEVDCIGVDSFIGYGGKVDTSCGNRCRYICSNEEKVVPAVGYILVK